ncbi:PrsW family intramembrane metalloprotease [Streptomyces roseicoloratus]|uniref:PrsW family intramembrane metalloprotease n=1 Tax=Streptomyces roseicoloratus TaxID=2508722 RepID=A0ABY9S373_9ACTN|nr:PrsW family intramembrane metalloprotease [Streptomyces roseicoloratus]WMX48896.1 PrsW family intramembrane metalloprotease [Streptomyces roseicoloratus]
MHAAAPVPALESDQPDFGAVPERSKWRYKPRKAFWRSRLVRAGVVIAALAICALAILAIVRKETGTEGFLVGLALAVLPVPLLLAAFRWLDRVEPAPWKNLLFALAWGAFASTLIAIFANSFAVKWISSVTADPGSAESLGATVVAPVVEETAKGAAILLLFLFRRGSFTGPVDGLVYAGFTATGFAFTENILYLGHAFGEDQEFGAEGLGSVTVATFFARVIMSPFAHPLFTSLTGLGLGFVALLPAGARFRRTRLWLLPTAGLLLAMGLHALWNGSATFHPLAFVLVYGMFMVPVFGLLTWLAIWSRQKELRTISGELPAYATAGWLAHDEPLALSSMRARSMARGYAARTFGKPGSRAVGEYEAFATTLAFLRHRARRGQVAPDFAAREQELLHHLWQRRRVASPALTYAARATGRVWVPPQYLDYGGYNPYRG